MATGLEAVDEGVAHEAIQKKASRGGREHKSLEGCHQKEKTRWYYQCVRVSKFSDLEPSLLLLKIKGINVIYLNWN